MGKKQRQKSHISKHIKTSHKHSSMNRKICFKKVDKTLKNINQIITKQMDKATKDAKQNTQPQQNKKIQLESISAEDLRKLLAGDKTTQKQRSPRINLDDSLILQKLLKRYGCDYSKMSKDIKLNRMQWTAKQIQKKHIAYNKIIEEQQNQ